MTPLIPGATPRAKRGPAADMRRRHTESANGSSEIGANGNGSEPGGAAGS